MNNNLIPSTNEITFEELYRKYSPDLFLYVSIKLNHTKEVAEDITNEAFVLLLEKWEIFNPKSYPALIAWLRKTARFLSYNFNRKTKQISTVPLNNMIENKNIKDPLTDYLCCEDIYRILQNLTEEEYQLFENIVFDNHSIKQTALIMNINPNTLKVRWFRLKNKIRRIL